MIFLYLNIKRVSFCWGFFPFLFLSPAWIYARSFYGSVYKQPCWVFFSGKAVGNWTYFPGLAELLACLSAFSEKLLLSSFFLFTYIPETNYSVPWHVFKCQKSKSFFCKQTVIILRTMSSPNNLHSHLQADVSIHSCNLR